MKIFKLLLLIIASCILWGYVANVSSDDTAKDWGNIAFNSNVFRLPIILKNNYNRNICYKSRRNRFNLTTTNRLTINPNRIGAFITNYPIVRHDKEMLVGIHVIPYLVNKTVKTHHYLIPNFDWIASQIAPFSRFYPACHSHSKDKETTKIAQHLDYYPLLLLKVTSKEQRDFLASYLQNLSFQARHFGQVNAKVSNINNLIAKIFQTKRVKFLKNLPFNVCLQLLDEKNVLKNEIEFAVINAKNSPSPCKNNSSFPSQTSTRPQVSCKQKRCLESQLESARAKLEQIINQNQTVLKTNKQYETLKKIVSDGELAEAIQKVFESHPEILTLDKKLAKCETKKNLVKPFKSTIYRSKNLWNKQITNTQRKVTATRHKLIVVSLAKFSERQQTAIRKSLIRVLAAQSYLQTSFSLRTIQTGRELSTPLLTTTELGNAKYIKAKIGNLQFGATDLIALNDLSLVDSIIQEDGDKMGKVLYITDNVNLNGKPPNKQRGVILAWYEDNIRLTVLTTGECTAWNKYMKAQCSSWQNRNQLENALKKFFY